MIGCEFLYGLYVPGTSLLDFPPLSSKKTRVIYWYSRHTNLLVHWHSLDYNEKSRKLHQRSYTRECIHDNMTHDILFSKLEMLVPSCELERDATQQKIVRYAHA